VFLVKRFYRYGYRRIGRGELVAVDGLNRCTKRFCRWQNRVTRHDATLRRYIRAGTMFDPDPLRGVHERDLERVLNMRFALAFKSISLVQLSKSTLVFRARKQVPSSRWRKAEDVPNVNVSVASFLSRQQRYQQESAPIYLNHFKYFWLSGDKKASYVAASGPPRRTGGPCLP
jgi:hypothetical protein